jgi:hypothetical protein
VADPELLAKTGIRRDLVIQLGDPALDIRDQAGSTAHSLTTQSRHAGPSLGSSPTKAKRRRSARSTRASDRSAMFMVPTT